KTVRPANRPSPTTQFPLETRRFPFLPQALSSPCPKTATFPDSPAPRASFARLLHLYFAPVNPALPPRVRQTPASNTSFESSDARRISFFGINRQAGEQSRRLASAR